MIVSTLAGLGHPLRCLLKIAGLARSTYYYLLSHPEPVTRPDIEPMVAEVFHRTPNGCGHRQVRMCLVYEFGVRVSHKSVLRVMRRMGLKCAIRRPNPYRRYSSYQGDTGAKPPNLLERDFAADRPWVKLGTDVTEFRAAGGKAYLAPIYDMGSKEIVAWDVSRHPDLAQQQRLLAMLEEKLPEGADPILHSDMGWQYQHDWWRNRLGELGIRQSMSRKGNCIDNAATEQVFGHLKDEFYTGREFASYEEFKSELDARTSSTGIPDDARYDWRDTPRRNSGTCPSQPNQVPLINHVQLPGRSSAWSEVGASRSRHPMMPVSASYPPCPTVRYLLFSCGVNTKCRVHIVGKFAFPGELRGADTPPHPQPGRRARPPRAHRGP